MFFHLENETFTRSSISLIKCFNHSTLTPVHCASTSVGMKTNIYRTSGQLVNSSPPCSAIILPLKIVTNGTMYLDGID